MTKDEQRLAEELGAVKAENARLKAKLRALRPYKPHRNSCASEDMTGHPAPCTCGADAANRAIDDDTY